MRAPLAFVFGALVCVAAGCSDDSVAPKPNQNSSTIQGTIGDSDFEFTFRAGGDPNDPIDGPFLLRGSNVQYDDSLHALTVDLTITNLGLVTQTEPIGLTFLRLFPEGVTVLNPDNGMHGAGAAIVFAFANDDGVWTPGETSLPHTVQFGVGPGVAVGFIARLDIGSPLEGGTIAGRVWNDANKDGIEDSTEEGLAGVLITLRSIDDESTRVPEYWQTLTGPDGHYEFNGLAPGVYIVSKALATVEFIPTTPTEITIVLTMHDGVVSDFLGADFGCVPGPPPPPPIEVGAYVIAQGKFDPFPPHLVATHLMVATCGNDTIPGPVDPPVVDCNGGVLRGVVTEVRRLTQTVFVMGTPIYFPDMPADLFAGQRIEVRVSRAVSQNAEAWVAVEWALWTGDYDGVEGRVDEAVIGEDGVLRIRVVDLWVVSAQIIVRR